MAATWKKLCFEEDAVLKTAYTAKGDLLGASAANTPDALHVGSDGKVLTADADAANGLGFDWVALGAPAAHAIDTHDDGTDITTNDANTSHHGLLIKAVAPASGILNVVGIANGETVFANKEIFDTTHPEALGTAGEGSQVIAARRDHVHAMPALDDIAVPDAAVNMNAQQIHDVVLDTYANAAALPTPAVIGQIAWATTELHPYVCTIAS